MIRGSSPSSQFLPEWPKKNLAKGLIFLYLARNINYWIIDRLEGPRERDFRPGAVLQQDLPEDRWKDSIWVGFVQLCLFEGYSI